MLNTAFKAKPLSTYASAVDRARHKVKTAKAALELAEHKLDRCLAEYTIEIFSQEAKK